MSRNRLPKPCVLSRAHRHLRRSERSRRARSQIVVFANFMLSLVVLVVLAAAAAVYFGKLAFNEPGPSDVTTNYVVKSGTGIVEIADGLERRSIITDARVFKYGVQAYGYQGDMKAGEYEIKAQCVHARDHGSVAQRKIGASFADDSRRA